MSTATALNYKGPFGKNRSRRFFEKQGFLSRRRRKSQGCWAGDAFSQYYEHEGARVNAFCVLCGRRVFLQVQLSYAMEMLSLIDSKAVASRNPKEVYAAFLLWSDTYRTNSLQSAGSMAAAANAGRVVQSILSSDEKSVLREKGQGLVGVWDGMDPDEFNRLISHPGEQSILSLHEMCYCNGCTLAFCPECVHAARNITSSEEQLTCPECLNQQCRIL